MVPRFNPPFRTRLSLSMSVPTQEWKETEYTGQYPLLFQELLTSVEVSVQDLSVWSEIRLVSLGEVSLPSSHYSVADRGVRLPRSSTPEEWTLSPRSKLSLY